jgi:hypothetical protein
VSALPRRIADIQVLRGLAVSAVFTQHYASWFPLKVAGSSLTFDFLWIGVDLFFVISGFLIVTKLLAYEQDAPLTVFKSFLACAVSTAFTSRRFLGADRFVRVAWVWLAHRCVIHSDRLGRSGFPHRGFQSLLVSVLPQLSSRQPLRREGTLWSVLEPLIRGAVLPNGICLPPAWVSEAISDLADRSLHMEPDDGLDFALVTRMGIETIWLGSWKRAGIHVLEMAWLIRKSDGGV